MNARPTRPTGIFTARAALCLTLGAALLASSVPAFAGDDDVPIDTKILRGVMESLGLRRDGEAINYEERAPLVIPPSHDLPPPERSDAAIANNPAWPIDPDVKRRKEEAAQEKRKSALNADQTLLHDQSVLRPDELTPGPKPRKAARQGDGGYQASPDGSSGPLSPSQLGVRSGFFSKVFGKDDDAQSSRFTGEPPRTALTEPPAGYQTPSPQQPYGVTKATAAPAPTNYLESRGTVDGNTN
jgi:hypothetical protein